MNATPAPLTADPDLLAADPDFFASDSGHSEVERIFQHFFSQKSLFTTIPHTPWSPPTDVYETTDAYVVRLEIPGIEDAKNNVSIELNHNLLTVRGYRRNTCPDVKLRFFQMEIHFGYFERVVTLPHSIDPRTLKGLYQDGFVRVTISKAPARRSVRRHITIHSGDPIE